MEELQSLLISLVFLNDLYFVSRFQYQTAQLQKGPAILHLVFGPPPRAEATKSRLAAGPAFLSERAIRSSVFGRPLPPAIPANGTTRTLPIRAAPPRGGDSQNRATRSVVFALGRVPRARTRWAFCQSLHSLIGVRPLRGRHCHGNLPAALRLAAHSPTAARFARRQASRTHRKQQKNKRCFSANKGISLFRITQIFFEAPRPQSHKQISPSPRHAPRKKTPKNLQIS